MNTVVQEWVSSHCTWKEQTVLFCALRGTDANGSHDLKSLTRWLRKTVLKNAAPDKTFMQETEPLDIDTIANKRPLGLDMLPVHFFGHLLHAFEVVGYRHPIEETRSYASSTYLKLCIYLHVEPENQSSMTERLRDEVKH